MTTVSFCGRLRANAPKPSSAHGCTRPKEGSCGGRARDRAHDASTVLAAELAETLTPEQVAEVVVTQGIASVGADAGAFQLLTDDGTMLEVVNGQGSGRR